LGAHGEEPEALKVRRKRAIEERKKIESSKLRMRKRGEDMRREEKDSSGCYRQRLVKAFAVARVQRNAAQRSPDRQSTFGGEGTVKARRDSVTQRNDRLIGNRPLAVKARRDTATQRRSATIV
jgi:hypothetical protein